jgi:hypothetical protein
MPEVSRFYGIIVRIFYDDHNPPHFHAEYGEHEVLVNINTLAILTELSPSIADEEILQQANAPRAVPLTADKGSGELAFRQSLCTSG